MKHFVWLIIVFLPDDLTGHRIILDTGSITFGNCAIKEPKWSDVI